MTKNSLYESPEVKVTEIIPEGILCQSTPGAGTGLFDNYTIEEW